ncbi:MAG: hypothetical protein CVV24_05840 [Ignavibacteriae bacterium HGW-Ignavibacteriae-3]|nr:MAG: hypothetical protein CVV24_05840 [Ignavibacteriae bacterium HGW-Ignavibacteriae-3]
MHKFLIIEDDEAARHLLKHILTKNFECEVKEAANGALGLQALSHYIPDLILLDISMPVMDGIEMLSRMRSNHNYKKIPVIVVTAINDRNVVHSLLEKGITDYLLKPIDKEVSIERIKKMINVFVEEGNNSLKESENHLLLVDKDENFNTFFCSILSEKFTIHQASNGVDGLELYVKHKPRYVFVSNSLDLLDKKILSNKIRELAKQREVSIFLLVNDAKAVTAKVFTYDAVIKKTMDKTVFLHDINLLKEVPSKKIFAQEKDEA